MSTLKLSNGTYHITITPISPNTYLVVDIAGREMECDNRDLLIMVKSWRDLYPVCGDCTEWGFLWQELYCVQKYCVPKYVPYEESEDEDGDGTY
jgi:hypothetical protein